MKNVIRVWIVAGALFLFSAYYSGLSFAEPLDFGYKAGITPSLDGSPVYQVGVSKSLSLTPQFIVYGSATLSGILDFSATEDDHLAGRLELRYATGTDGSYVVLSHKQVVVSGDGVVTREFGKKPLTSIEYKKNF